MPAVRIAKSKRSRPSTAEMGRLFAEFKESPATICADTIAEIDQALMFQPHGAARRVGLTVFTKSGAELLALANRDRAGAVVVAGTAKAAEIAAGGLRAAADMLDAARERGLLALCERTDVDSVMAEAEATYSDDVEVGHA
jgi:hypothetical protein